MIYLLKTSPYNEDFLLDGYATDVKELETLARRYYADVYFSPNDVLDISINMERKELVLRDTTDEIQITFHIVVIKPVTFDMCP